MIFGFYTPEISAGLVLILIVSIVAFQLKRIDHKLNTWASERGYKIIDISSGGLKNPFFLNLKRASVYHVKVKDNEGKERTCWLRVPQYGYNIDCKWEDE